LVRSHSKIVRVKEGEQLDDWWASGTVAVAATYFEVWDDGTGNRVGGSFATEDEARALLQDVLRVNGPEAASEMAILAFRPNADGRFEPVTILEGADFVAQARATASAATSRSAGQK
jgi:hypothetical protein